MHSNFQESNYLQAGALDSSADVGAAAVVEAAAAAAAAAADLVASAAEEGTEEVELGGFELEVSHEALPEPLRLEASPEILRLEALVEPLRYEEQSEHQQKRWSG